MIITNKTSWATLDLKKVLTKALDEDDKIEGKYKHRSYLEVTISYSKGHPSWVVKRYQEQNKELPIRERYSGSAWVGGIRMKLRVPREKFNVERFARVFIHEMSHIRGFRSHRTIGIVKDGDLKWTTDYSVRQKGIKVKPKTDLQLKRYEHVMGMLKAKKTQLKRLQNQIKKWNQKRKYYESVLVANGKIKDGEEVNC